MAFLICTKVSLAGIAMWLKPLGQGHTVNALHAGRFTMTTARRLAAEDKDRFIVPASALRKELETLLIVDISTPETLAKLMAFDTRGCTNGVNS